MAMIARLNDRNSEMGIFYSHIGACCTRLHSEAQLSSRLDDALADRALVLLDSLIAQHGLQELQAIVTLHSRLQLLNICWKDVKKQQDDVKLNFVRRWLKPVASQKDQESWERDMEGCIDQLSQHQPIHHPNGLAKLALKNITEPSQGHNFLIEETTEATSLAQYIEAGHTGLNEKTKRLPSLIIAHNVLHLNGTSWLQTGWGSSNIKFFQKASSEIPLRPFIERPARGFQFASSAISVENIYGEKVDDEGCDPDLSHPCPALVTLAVILMEIKLKKPFRKMAEEHGIHFVNGSDGPILLLVVDQVFNGGEESHQDGWRTQIPENTHLFTAIENCLDCELWEEEDSTSLDPKALRLRIYENVVHPLEQHLIHRRF
ncbi:pfs domain-containing protein [Colletotrichum sojae]|uniref:Pfs domain-containing protein n=1 Tax=Colletotrichum sojae TaxID=2175907 RepID=A0A8H6MY94_9PEZI|nr:pfs domain-containing protein [Colletotrichum sojae]